MMVRSATCIVIQKIQQSVRLWTFHRESKKLAIRGILAICGECLLLPAPPAASVAQVGDGRCNRGECTRFCCNSHATTQSPGRSCFILELLPSRRRLRCHSGFAQHLAAVPDSIVVAAEVAHVVALPVNLHRSIQVNQIEASHSLLVPLPPSLQVDDVHDVLQQTQLQLLVTHLHQHYVQPAAAAAARERTVSLVKLGLALTSISHGLSSLSSRMS
jgi:hypothetical protein